MAGEVVTWTGGATSIQGLPGCLLLVASFNASLGGGRVAGGLCAHIASPGNSAACLCRRMRRLFRGTCDAPISALVGGRKEGGRCNSLALLQIRGLSQEPRNQ